jgi:hypothetical protein
LTNAIRDIRENKEENADHDKKENDQYNEDGP